MATNFYTTDVSGASNVYGKYNAYTNPPVDVSLDNLRRTFDLSGMIAELRPMESPFFTYLTKVRRVTTPDPIFKMMEQRHQWQRRNFHVATALAKGQDVTAHATGIVVKCYYDLRGKETSSEQDPAFFVAGQVVAIENVTEDTGQSDTGTLYARVIQYGETSTKLSVTPLFLVGTNVTGGKKTAITATNIAIPDNSRAQVVGTSYAEGSSYPDSWYDVLSQTEGYAQIFKTACPLMSGTAMATELRGKKNEFARIWDEKMREHKMDMEHAFLFGVGNVTATSGQLGVADGTTPKRYTWGALPFINLYGNNAAFSYAASGYNDFVDWCEGFFAPENGNSMSKLVLASRKIVGWFNKLGNGTFLGNTLVAEASRLDVQAIKSQFGFNLTRVNTVFGELNFVAHPLLRGQWEDYVIVIDLPNLAYRPLVGNGISRDTFYQTNVQAPGVDGRIDQMITEAGLQILLPETHAVLKWS